MHVWERQADSSRPHIDQGAVGAALIKSTPNAGSTVEEVVESPDDRPGDGGGIGHFGFRLVDEEDLDRAVKEVERAGGRLIRRGEHPDGQPFAYVTDPDGYVIEL